MNRLKTIIAISLVCLFTSCSSRKIKDQLSDFIGKEIVISQVLEATYIEKGSNLPHNADIKLIVWFNTDNCTSCKVKSLYEWHGVMCYFSSLRQRASLIFIFTPSKAEVEILRIALKSGSVPKSVSEDRS